MEKRKTILRILYRLTILFLLPMVAGCDSASRELHEALNLAGDNRPELQKALDYFSDDPLKREACEFLIRNMPGHYSYGGEFLEDFRESITQPEARSPYFREMMASVLYQDKRAKEQWKIDAEGEIQISALKVKEGRQVLFEEEFESIKAQRADHYYVVDADGKFRKVRTVDYPEKFYSKDYLQNKNQNIWDGGEEAIASN